MSELYIDYEDHYNADYFTGKKKYTTPDGQEHTYHGPALTWDGFRLVADAIGPLFKAAGVKSILDIGCSGGDLINFLANRFGFATYGVDISEYAIKNAAPELKDRVGIGDITQGPTLRNRKNQLLPSVYDAIMATDLMEHIYEEDLDKTFTWMKEKTNRWMFLCIAVAFEPNHPFSEPHKLEFNHKKGTPVPPEFRATAISGHVNVRGWRYWAKFFTKNNCKIHWDLMYLFQMARECDKAWRDTGGWAMPSTFIVEKLP